MLQPSCSHSKTIYEIQLHSAATARSNLTPHTSHCSKPTCKMEKICWQITVAAFMQPLQYDLRSPAAKDNSITNAATARSNLDAAITMRSAETELPNTIELRATASEIVAPTPCVDRTCTKHRWNPIYNAEPIRSWSDHDPSMIRPHTRPSRTRRTAEVDHRGSGTDFVWKNIGFRASAISQKRISCETSFKNPTWRCHLQLTLSLTNSFFD